MYRRFLNDDDYQGVISPETLSQMTRGNGACFIQAEQSAEMSVIEHLSENYEVEKELDKGRYIALYDRSITFPVGAHFYYQGKIHEVTRSISGYKQPSDVQHWEEYIPDDATAETIRGYSQMATYYPGDVVCFNGTFYRCLQENGAKFGEIRIPMVNGWKIAEANVWQPTDYYLWDVVQYEGSYYTLISPEGQDYNINPVESDNWGAIADYDSEYNQYELSEHEYVVYRGRVFYPETDVNADPLLPGHNCCPHDPRNYNLKKHLVRLAIYELTKLVAPNNVSVVRVKDYEDSMRWLSDAAKLKINPQIPRKLQEDKKEVMDWQMATFQTDYNPYKNPWMT